jgi:Putative beta-barrel porin 2
MKKTIFAILVVTAAASVARGQGLLSIGANHDFDEKMPFSVTIASSVGWDSNMNTSPDHEQESGYWQNGISVYYPMGDRRNHFLIGAHYSNIYYFDPAPGTEDVYHNARLTFDFSRDLSPRMAITDSFYLAYEAEPDMLIGMSANRRVNQYLYGYNNLALSYAWTRRFSTVTSYTLTGIWYEDDLYKNEDHLSHIFGQQFRYSLSRTTTLTLDYRFQWNNYDNNDDADSTTHYILAGVDHSFSPQLTGSLRVGAQIRNYEGPVGTSTAPYLEGAINYKAGKNTILRWYNYLGFDDAELAGFGETYSYHTGLTIDHKLTERLTGSLSLNYVHSEFSDSPDGLNDFSDDVFAGSVGLDFRVWRNISLNGSYWYTMNSSDSDIREYDRHRVSFGISATF